MTEQEKIPFEASFSVLTMSIASSAAFSLGLSPDPQTGKTHIDKNMAKFNIDLLLVLQEKSKGNLNADEDKLIKALLSDLQMKFLTIK
jgi:hypothetical protein